MRNGEQKFDWVRIVMRVVTMIMIMMMVTVAKMMTMITVGGSGVYFDVKKTAMIMQILAAFPSMNDWVNLASLTHVSCRIHVTSFFHWPCFCHYDWIPVDDPGRSCIFVALNSEIWLDFSVGYIWGLKESWRWAFLQPRVSPWPAGNIFLPEQSVPSWQRRGIQ